MMVRKYSRGKHQEKMLDGPTKWVNVKNKKATRDGDVWKVMIAIAKEQGT